MADTVACPSCARTLRIPETVRDQEVRCPGCQTTFRAPSMHLQAPSSAPAPAAPTYKIDTSDEEDESSPSEPRSNRRRRRHFDLDDDDSLESHGVGTRGLCNGALVLMLGNIGVAVVNMPLQLIYLRVLDRLGKSVPHPAAPEDLENADSLEAIMGLLAVAQLAFYLGFVVVFLIWLYRSYANLSK